MGKLQDKMIRDMQLRRFSASTHRSYLRAVRDLAKYYGRSPDKITCDEVHDYLIYVMTERRLNWSTVNGICSGLTFFYTVTLAQKGSSFSIPPRKTPAFTGSS